MSASLLLDDLAKAARSMRVSLFNNTTRPLKKDKAPCVSGSWKVAPPDVLEPLSTAEFGSESNGVMGGTEAGVLYTAEGVEGVFEFGWNNPYFGKRGYKKTVPAGFDVEFSAPIDSPNCIVSFVLTETAGQRTTKEVQQDIATLEKEIDEAIKVNKGIQKMSAVYSSQKDIKSAKLVEDQITAKQHEIEAKRKRIDMLKQELEKKKKEEDPVNLEKELQKVKVRIEAAVKVRNGIEHMRDMYTTGSQKDSKQAVLVEQQIESKKREIEALRRFEQRLIERIVTSKANTPAATDQAVLLTTTTTTVRRAKALYDLLTPASDNELVLNANEVVIILDQSSPDWWEAEHVDGRRGFVPAAYVEILPEETMEESSAFLSDTNVAAPHVDSVSATVDKSVYSHLYPKARVIYDHVASETGESGEISLKLGDELTVHSWDDQYWWQGEINGTSGYFPCHCVQWIEPEGAAAQEIVLGESGSYYEEAKSLEATPTDVFSHTADTTAVSVATHEMPPQPAEKKPQQQVLSTVSAIPFTESHSEAIVSLPDSAISLPENTGNILLPGNTIPLPGNTIPLPEHAIPLPGNAIPLPGNAFPLPGNIIPLPGNTIALPGDASENVKETLPPCEAKLPTQNNATPTPMTIKVRAKPAPTPLAVPVAIPTTSSPARAPEIGAAQAPAHAPETSTAQAAHTPENVTAQTQARIPEFGTTQNPPRTPEIGAVQTPASKDNPRPSPRATAAPSPRTTTPRPLPVPTRTASSLTLDGIDALTLSQAIQNQAAGFIIQLQQAATEILNGTITRLEQKHVTETQILLQGERTRFEELQVQIAELQNSYSNVCKERDKLQQKYDSMLQKHDSMSQKYDILSQTYDSMSQKYDTLSQNYDSVSAERDYLKSANSRLEAERAETAATRSKSSEDSGANIPRSEGGSTPRESSGDLGLSVGTDTTKDQMELPFAHRRALFEQATRKRTGI